MPFGGPELDRPELDRPEVTAASEPVAIRSGRPGLEPAVWPEVGRGRGQGGRVAAHRPSPSTVPMVTPPPARNEPHLAAIAGS